MHHITTLEGYLQHISQLVRAEAQTPSSFWAFVYAPGTDVLEWREFTRNTLLDHLTRQTIGNLYLNGHPSQWGVTRQQAVLQILRRISASNDLFDSEVRPVQAAWREWWGCYGASVRIAGSALPLKTQ